MKISANFRFDEGFNDLPLSEHPPNAIGLANTQDGTPFPEEDTYISAEDLQFYTSPFATTITKTLSVSDKQPISEQNCFGFVLASGLLNNRVFVDKVLPRSDASKMIGRRKKCSSTNNWFFHRRH